MFALKICEDFSHVAATSYEIIVWNHWKHCDKRVSKIPAIKSILIAFNSHLSVIYSLRGLSHAGRYECRVHTSKWTTTGLHLSVRVYLFELYRHLYLYCMSRNATRINQSSVRLSYFMYILHCTFVGHPLLYTLYMYCINQEYNERY